MSKKDLNPKVKVETVHPEAEQAQNAKEEEIKAFIGDIHGELESIISSREEWENRQVRWYRERYGIRSTRNFPWPGASNIHIPTIDIHCRKLLPSYVNLMWGPEHIAEFTHDPHVETADQLEDSADHNAQVLNHIIKDQMTDPFKKSVLWTDRMLQSGFCLVKVTYEYKTRQATQEIDLEEIDAEDAKVLLERPDIAMPENERASADYLLGILAKKGYVIDPKSEKDMKSVDKNVKKFQEGHTKFVFDITIKEAQAPLWTVVKPQDLIIHGSINAIQDAELVGHRSYWSAQELRQATADGMFDPEVAQEVLGGHLKAKATGPLTHSMNSQTSIESTISQATGSYHYGESTGDEPIEIREVCCYGMPDGSGIQRRCILTYAPDYQEKPLRFVEMPYDDGKWPFVKFQFECKDDGWLSNRGVPHMLDYIATTINVQHNQKIDRQTITNAPMMKAIPGQVSPTKIRFIPGQTVAVKSMDALQPIVFPQGQMSYVEEERMLREYAEQYLSSPDFGLTDSNAPASKARTATEISQISSQRAQAFGLDARLYLSSLGELLEMTWARWLQYGPEEYEMRLKGQENPVVWKKQYGIRGMKIRPKGRLQDTNPSLKAQKAQAKMEIARMAEFAPWIKTREALEDFYKADDPESVDENLKSIEEYQQEQEGMKQQQQEQVQQAQEIELTKLKIEHEQKMEEIKLQGKIDMMLVRAKGEADSANEIVKNKLNPNGDNGNGSKEKNNGRKPSVKATTARR
jgi:hypothetical protein